MRCSPTVGQPDYHETDKEGNVLSLLASETELHELRVASRQPGLSPLQKAGQEECSTIRIVLSRRIQTQSTLKKEASHSSLTRKML